MNPLAEHLVSMLPRLWRFALRLTKHKEDAEDLVQRTCVRALERQHQWDAQTNPLPWLYSIMYSVWMNELESRRLRRVESLTVDGEEDVEIIDRNSIDPEAAAFYRQVVVAVESLPDAQRVVMLVVAVEGFSYREASDVLQVPIGTVMSRLSRARSLIGERFSRSNRPANQSNVA